MNLSLGSFSFFALIAISSPPSWSADKMAEDCLELKLRAARNELIAAAKAKGPEALPKWHLAKDWVMPPPGAADYFRKDGRDIYGMVDKMGDGSVTATFPLSRDAKGQWEIGVLRHSKILFRIFESSEVRQFLKGYKQGAVSISYGRFFSGGFTSDRIEYSGYHVMITQLRGKAIGDEISIMFASGLGPVDNTGHYDEKGGSGQLVAGNGKIAMAPPKDTDLSKFSRLHEARSGNLLPYLRLSGGTKSLGKRNSE